MTEEQNREEATKLALQVFEQMMVFIDENWERQFGSQVALQMQDYENRLRLCLQLAQADQKPIKRNLDELRIHHRQDSAFDDISSFCSRNKKY